MSKRSIAAYFLPASSKKPRTSTSSELIPSTHTSYPFPIRCLPTELELASRNRRNDEGEDKDDIEPVHMDGNDDLDMLYYHPFLNNAVAKELFLFLRRELPFYRVEYKINRSGVETLVGTPRLYVGCDFPFGDTLANCAYEVRQSSVSTNHPISTRVLVSSLIQDPSSPSQRTDTVPVPQDQFHNVWISCVRYV